MHANAYLRAPYGIYQTRDRYLALAMEDLGRLGQVLGCHQLLAYRNGQQWFCRRNEIMAVLGHFLRQQDTAHWLALLEPADIWCADVLRYEELLHHQAFRVLQMEQQVVLADQQVLKTTRCPIRFDGERLFSSRSAPLVGQHNLDIDQHFELA
jgi:crotonobetainyl-CoA:carnitine CoA-transferase CaiB-like acyl-CoA transferase